MIEERLRSHYATLERAIGFTRVADAKAAPLLALQTALAGALVSQAGPLTDLIAKGDWDAERMSGVGLFGAYVLSSVLALVLAALVYHPMNPPARGSLIYFEDVARMEYDAFASASKALDQNAIEEQLLDQIYRVARIASGKMARVRRSMVASTPSFATWGSLLGLALT